jgi:hypothetical protein
MKPIEILQTGTFHDSSGTEQTFTEADLEAIASSYDPTVHEAPVVIGHPINTAPAFGWISRVFKEGEKLFCELKDLVPEFVDAIKSGLYKKRSISLYPDRTIRHLGFLGAVPPAIKGLADIQFSECNPITFEMEIDHEADQRPAGEKLVALVNIKMRENKEINFSEAGRQVCIENIELAEEYAKEIRPF